MSDSASREEIHRHVGGGFAFPGHKLGWWCHGFTMTNSLIVECQGTQLGNSPSVVSQDQFIEIDVLVFCCPGMPHSVYEWLN